MPRVFDVKIRTDDTPAFHSENTYQFLDRVAGAYWDDVRNLVEQWFERVPDAARNDPLGRLRSSDKRHFGAAFWELYLVESFQRGGFDVAVHPEVPSSPRPPDFLVSKGNDRFYVEAKAIFGGPTAGSEARKTRLYDALEKLDSPNFFLSIEVYRVGPQDPATRQLRQDLEAWLRRLDPDDPELRDWGRDQVQEFRWDKEGWSLRFRPIPIQPEFRGRPDHRVLGVFGPGEAYLVEDAATLKMALRKEGNAYGALDLPLVVAVNVSSGFHKDSDTTAALFGSEMVQFEVGGHGDARLPVDPVTAMGGVVMVTSFEGVRCDCSEASKAY